MNAEEWLKEFRKCVEFNPSTDESSFNEGEVKRLITEYKEEKGLTFDPDKMPFFNILFVLYGYRRPSSLDKLGVDGRGKYHSIIDPIDKFIKSIEDVTKKFYQLKGN